MVCGYGQSELEIQANLVGRNSGPLNIAFPKDGGTANHGPAEARTVNYEFYWLVINVLVVWRFAHLLFAGGWSLESHRAIKTRGRQRILGKPDGLLFLSKSVGCLSGGNAGRPGLEAAPAIVAGFIPAGAILVERATSKTETGAPAQFYRRGGT